MVATVDFELLLLEDAVLVLELFSKTFQFFDDICRASVKPGGNVDWCNSEGILDLTLRTCLQRHRHLIAVWSFKPLESYGLQLRDVSRRGQVLDQRYLGGIRGLKLRTTILPSRCLGLLSLHLLVLDLPWVRLLPSTLSPVGLSIVRV